MGGQWTDIRDQEGSKEWVDIRLKAWEVNANQTEWVKNLDYKICYYTAIFLLAIAAWVTTELPIPVAPEKLIITAVIVVSTLAVIFLVRNHLRHWRLNIAFHKLVNELKLTSIYQRNPWEKLLFNLGRILYAIIIIIGCFAIIIFIKHMMNTSRSDTGRETANYSINISYNKNNNSYLAQANNQENYSASGKTPKKALAAVIEKSWLGPNQAVNQDVSLPAIQQ